MRHQFKAKDSIQAFNQLRQTMQFPLTETQFRQGLKACNILYGANFIQELCNSGVVLKSEDNMYTFVNPTVPIHYNELQRIYDIYYKRRSKAVDSSKRIKKFNKEKVIQAIKFLQERGFVIFRDVTDLLDCFKGSFDIARFGIAL